MNLMSKCNKDISISKHSQVTLTLKISLFLLRHPLFFSSCSRCFLSSFISTPSFPCPAFPVVLSLSGLLSFTCLLSCFLLSLEYLVSPLFFVISLPFLPSFHILHLFYFLFSLPPLSFLCSHPFIISACLIIFSSSPH